LLTIPLPHKWGEYPCEGKMKKLYLLLALFFSTLGFGVDTDQNFLINGGFDLFQRGTANANVSAEGYLADRWFSTAGTYNRNASNLPTGQNYGAQLAFSSGSGWLCQRVESANVKFLGGQKMTVSGYERSSIGTGPLKLKIDQPNTRDNYAGRGRSGTTLTNEIPATTLLATTSTTLTSWRYTFSVSSNMASYGFQVCLGTDTSTTTTYQLSALMLNKGIKKASFTYAGKDISEEISKAQRYFEKSWKLENTPAAGVDNIEVNTGQDVANIITHFKFGTVKRIIPTYWTVSNGNSSAIFTGGNGCYEAQSCCQICDMTMPHSTTSGFSFKMRSNSGYGSARYFGWWADAEL